MLREIVLRFGPTGPAENLRFLTQAMTLFVGPNGSGKSLALREIKHYVEHGLTPDRKVIEQVVPDIPEPEDVERLLASRTSHMANLSEGVIRVTRMDPAAGGLQNYHVNERKLLQRILSVREGPQPDHVMHEVFTNFLFLFLVSLDGKSRFALTEQRPMGDLLEPATNVLGALFRDGEARRRVRELTADAFGLHFVVDPTAGGVLRARWSERAPRDEQEEQALDERARAFHAAALSLENVSDGVKAFTGLMSAFLGTDYRIMLVDEPEAFLHPPLARKLGSRMTQLASDRDARVIASTHSADFLMGCVEGGGEVNIVRLTYEQGTPSARLLPSASLQELMRDPLLRSTTPLSALFHASAVVCESDRDMAFYREINWRLETAGKPYIRDAAFLRAQNKQSIRRIVGPLRNMGIPAAAVVDLDILKGGDLNDLCDACNVPNATKQGIAATRGTLERAFKDAGVDMKSGDLRDLPAGTEEALTALLDQLATHGIFVVPCGEVECWLRYLNVEANKQEWLTKTFEVMGSDPDHDDYVRPREGDVWDFLGAIATWAANPQRLGM